jgi:hypothetical protein
MSRLSVCSLSFILMLCFGLAGCGGSNMMPPPAPASFFSGLYQITGISASNPSGGFMINGSLIQTGNNVSGVMHLNLSSCFASSVDIPVTGTTGDTVDLALSLPAGQMLSFSLTHPGGHLSNLAGNYTLTGAGCLTPDQGTASGENISVTGIWQGTFTSNSGVSSQISMTLMQMQQPDVHGGFSATGTATITGGTCFSGATVDPATAVIGPGSQLVFDNSQSGTTGKTTLQGDFGPMAFGGASFLGTYTSTQGACSDSGSVSMSII